MEGESGQSRSGGLNQSYGNFERSSGEKTPKTPPCHGERSRSQSGASVSSGRSSHRLISSCEKTSVTGSDLKLKHATSVSRSDRTSKDDTLHTKEHSRGFAVTEASNKREENNDEVQTQEGADEYKYGSGSNNICRCQSNQSISSFCGPDQQEANRSRGNKGKVDRSLKKSKGKKNRGQKERVAKGYETSTEDSACSIFRSHWNESIKSVARKHDVETSEVFIMQRFVDTQSKALDLADEQDDNRDLADRQNAKDCWEPKCEDEVFTKQKAVAAVLTFQRWRHTQLKRLFSLELKKVLEEAKEDEACLAKLEMDLATKDRHILQLRNQLSSYENAFEAQTVQKHAIDTNVSVSTMNDVP
ncbi:hypothetical protein R1flu_018674 [Riccia fluitans]|uniref:Uncharacterized protein n=1 Tax=Riccia fluitans TaxID=41844 RepID=A0ABD1ZI12_9MARC